MAVQEQIPYQEYVANGVTKVFPLEFDCKKQDHLIVLVNDVEPSHGSWSLDVIEDTVTFILPPVTGAIIKIQRDTPMSRSTKYQSYNNSFRPATVDDDFDTIWRKMQELGVLNWLANNNIKDLNEYVDSLNDETKVVFLAMIEKQGVSLSQLDSYVDQLYNKLANTAVEKGWLAEFIATKEGFNQQQVNDLQAETNEKQLDKNSLSIDLLEFIPKAEWQAIFNKTSNYDCSPALTQSIATGKQVVINSRGLYKIKTVYSGITDFDLKMSEGVVLDLSECSGSYAIKNTGSLTKLSATYGSITAGFHKLTLSDITGLAVGDWLCFYDSRQSSYSYYRANYNDGEWKQIKRISGKTLSFNSPFLKTYTVALDIYKLNSVVCKIEGGEIINNSLSLVGSINFGLSMNAQVHNLTANAKQNSVILFDRCVEPKSSNINGTNEGAGTDDYFIVHSNCWHGTHNGGKFYSRRHAFAMGGGSGPCNVPNTGSIVENAILDCDPDALVGAADMHGNVRFSEYRGCTITGGTNIGGGEENYYKNCKIMSDSYGRAGFIREITGGSYGWLDCEIIFTADPQQFSRGVFDLGGNESPITANTVNDQTVNIKRIKVKDTGVTLGGVTSFTKLVNRGTNRKINFDIDDITFNTTSKFYLGLSISLASGATALANSDYIIFDNVKGNLPSGQIVSAPTNTEGKSYINTKMRLPISSGLTSITTTLSTQALSPMVTLPINYPRNPIPLALTARGVNGATKSTFGGQKNPLLSVCNQSTTNNFKSQITAPENFTADDLVEVAYSFGIREC